ncbi:uncharacterized protein ASPGLDRAFT_55667 [Aspergillus glaucus CBS 516.65]|uniref:Uncharacterized protein n=1 Tax=Aspergillus glaucus CBS 516.65 TaxID=1160497 RepID=A0A1L9VTF8_ASPGL|nr:hypothetical protein ASPGLDRAFT_55667 [Aspergillus glaucus CBS 516.65]OJJ87187.1 hypothetical protein ASPGLDRAFT_55667 [Aspergillus glaucus CBS 516.65]
MTSVQETVSPSEKHIQEESTDYESLFNNSLWITNPDLTQPASETKAAEVIEEPPSQPKSLSHGERIKELKFLLKDSQLKYQKENIQAAIKYHETFKPEEQCGSKKAFFKHGSQVEEEEFKHPQACNCIGGWAEPPYENPWCKIIDERVDDSNQRVPEEIEAKAEKKREKELRELNKNMLHGLGSSMFKPFRRLTKAVRN